MRITLQVLEGDRLGEKRSLRAPATLSFGRTERSDWPFPGDLAMSSIHCELKCSIGACHITDLGSTNGTHVNDESIQSQALRDGDRVRIGGTLFVVNLDAAKTQDVPQIPQASIDSGDPDSDPVDQPSPAIKSNEASPTVTTTSSVDEPRHRHRRGAVIEVVSANARGQKMTLRIGQKISVGRTDRSDLMIADPQMSATHFVFESVAAGWQITDLNSTSGTTINGMKTAYSLVYTGDKIVAGHTEFVVEIGPSSSFNTARDPKTEFPFHEGISDPDPEVQFAALHAAAWLLQPWLLQHCRTAELSLPNANTVYFLGVLGNSSDIEQIRAGIQVQELGQQRFEACAALGLPELVEDLIASMETDEPRSAIAAGEAFSRITGFDIDSEEVATLPPEDGSEPTEFEQEFLDQAPLPNVMLAKQLWSANQHQFCRGVRYQRGHDVSEGLSEDLTSHLDLRSCWEASVRSHYEQANARVIDATHPFAFGSSRD